MCQTGEVEGNEIINMSDFITARFSNHEFIIVISWSNQREQVEFYLKSTVSENMKMGKYMNFEMGKMGENENFNRVNA